MTAVSEASYYAATNHYNASQQGRVIQVVSTLHTPMGLSPPTGHTQQVLFETCQMIMTREGVTRCSQQPEKS